MRRLAEYNTDRLRLTKEGFLAKNGSPVLLHRWETPEGSVEFMIPMGEWIRLFRRTGFVIEALIEVQPPEGATSTYRSADETAWARGWPMEQIWKVRKA